MNLNGKGKSWYFNEGKIVFIGEWKDNKAAEGNMYELTNDGKRTQYGVKFDEDEEETE
jgi:hypothetical protein